MATLEDLQRWYDAQCNGDWEHSYGIKISTMDNPGWHVEIDLPETLLEDRPFTPVRQEDLRDLDSNDDGWLDCKVEDRRFVGMGGPFQLGRIIDVFLSWAKSLPAPHDWLDTPDDVEMAARADRAFRDALGEEVGPEPCRHPGCDRNRIRHSVLCRKHHYEQVKGRPYDE